MTFLYIVLGVLGLILILLAICVIRALMMKPTAAISAKINMEPCSRSQEYGEKLGELIKCETISSRYDDSRDKFYSFHKILETMFPNIHAKCEKHDFNGSLLFKWPGKAEREPILLMSHQDVVEATGAWQHDPFCGELIDGKVWGRGTVDTKGNLFCFYQAVEELIAEGFVPPCDVYLASSCTEEFSGEGAPLTAQWLQDNGVKLRLMLDEGGMIMEEPIAGLKGVYGVVGVVEKGYGDLKFIARSGGGHASAPGKNTPLVRLGKFMVDVEKKSPFTPKMNDTIEEMFRRFAPNMKFGMKVLMGNLWLFRPLLTRMLGNVAPVAGAMIQTTCAFTTAKGSDGLNVLPQEAYVTGNLRFIQHQDDEESISIISGLAKKYDLETEVIYSNPPCPVVNFRSEAFRLVEETMAEIYPNVGVSPYVMTGGTDCKAYSEVCDNCLRFAPLYINKQQFQSIHGLDENIDAAALRLGVDFFRRFLNKV